MTTAVLAYRSPHPLVAAAVLLGLAGVISSDFAPEPYHSHPVLAFIRTLYGTPRLLRFVSAGAIFLHVLEGILATGVVLGARRILGAKAMPWRHGIAWIVSVYLYGVFSFLPFLRLLEQHGTKLLKRN